MGREDVVGAPAQQKVERLTEQLADLRAEHRVDIGERSDPTAEVEAAGGVFLRPARGLHYAVHRNHRPDNNLSHGSLLFCPCWRSL